MVTTNGIHTQTNRWVQPPAFHHFAGLSAIDIASLVVHTRVLPGRIVLGLLTVGTRDELEIHNFR